MSLYVSYALVRLVAQPARALIELDDSVARTHSVKTAGGSAPALPPASSTREDQCASGSGLTWMCTARGLLPLPPSISHGVRSPLLLHSPRPFQPAFGSSMRPSRPLA